MTAPESRDAQSGVEEVLAEHWAAVGPVTGAWLCTCGTRSTNGHVLNNNLTSKEERQAEYRAHVAAALEPLLAAERAKVLREAAEEIPAQVAIAREVRRRIGDWLREYADREQP